MRTILISLAMFLTFSGTAMAGAEDACMRCHNPDGNKSLAGVDDLVSKIKSVRDGDVKHPPGLDGLSDADIEAIASALGAG